MVGPSIRWKSDFEKYVVISNFQRRGWKRAEAGEDEGWHIYWANVNTVKNIFLPESGTRLEPYQLLNHFPNHYELTRKDLMVKNLKRYSKQMRKAGVAVPDMLPVTYMLPQDYRLFAEEFKRSGGGQQTTWIVKPTSRAQGKGIFLLKKLSQVKRWETPLLPNATRPAAENHVVSRYIDNPLLIGGKKFDMRIYVVVTSFKPLKVYMSRLGFARFCNMKYSAEAGELDNQFVHLTNVSIQKQQGKQYNSQHGNKWSLSNLRLYIESMYSATAAGQLLHEALWAWPNALWRLPAYRNVPLLTTHKDIEAIVLHSLKACQSAIIQDRHCFELYGYDIIIDDTLKPWLIEVNASPSLACTTPWDRQMKARLIHDTLNVVCSPDWAKSISRRPASAGIRTADSLQDRQAAPGQGSLYLLYDETQQMQQERARREFASVADRGGAKARSAFV